jgi:transcription initiation factor TFIID subunit TAF12
MPDTPSERRLAENEAIFRQLNEQVNAGFDETNKLAQEDNQPEFVVTPHHDDSPIQFFCECADENCTDRITVTLIKYQEIHKNRNDFMVVPGHEVTSVEKILLEQPDYSVVEKNAEPPENPETLHPTSIDNT